MTYSAHEDRVGKRVVIVGGGAVGVELGIHLNSLGHECTILEMGEYIVAKAQLTERTAYLNAMREYKVNYLENATCTEITDKSVRVSTPEGSRELEADTVIIAVGTKRWNVNATGSLTRLSTSSTSATAWKRPPSSMRSTRGLTPD